MTIRPGMVLLVNELRQMTDTQPLPGLNDDVTNYFSDEDLEIELDRVSGIVKPTVTRFSPTTYSVTLRQGDFVTEAPSFGSARFDLRTYDNIPVIYQPGHVDSYVTNSYLGQIIFNRDRLYEQFVLYTVGYKLNSAAASVWNTKASRLVGAVDFRTDNHTISASQEYEHCLERYRFYSGLSGLKNTRIVRGDHAFRHFTRLT